MKSVLVVPSCRPDSLAEFLRAWNGVGDWDELIVVEDGPTRSFQVPDSARHYAWADIRTELGEDAWIISRRDSAIRCFGFLMAYRAGADLVITLDDDCYPHDGRPIAAGHLAAMESHPRWVESIPAMRTRGLPYRNRGRLHVVANMGLWSNVPDIDAVRSLALAGCHVSPYEPPAGNRIMPPGQYWPLCGMNLAFRRAAAPLMYFPLMGEGSTYRRFDDIWCGVILQRIASHLGWHLSAGEPIVEHRRASDPFANLVKEAPGIAANEIFWEAIDAVPLSARTPAGCMDELGRGLGHHADGYLRELGRAMRVWASLFEEIR